MRSVSALPVKLFADGADILAKLELVGRDLHDYSLETVKTFRDDALKAGFTL